MPARGTPKKLLKAERICRRRQVPFADSELERLKAEARAAGLTQTKYMRRAVLSAWGAAEKPKPKRRNDDEAIAALHKVAYHLKKIGANINQLAHQANAGLVPLTPAQCIYLANAIQLAISETKAATERVA